MKTIPQTNGDWSPAGDLVNAGLRHRIFVAALQLKLFDHLDNSSVDEIAHRLGLHPRNTGLLLNALAGMDLIRKQGGRYEHTPLSAEFLASQAPAYLGHYLLHVSRFHEQFPVDIEDLVSKGPAPEAMSFDDEAIWAESARLSAAYQYSGEAQHMARVVSELPEFSGMRSMLDLGGGSGFYTMAIVSMHPSLQGTIFEQPAVAAVARGFVQEYGMQERVSVIDGNYMLDDLGGPHDLVFASATLNFFKPHFDELFVRVHESLAHGGVFITHQDGVRDERTKPANLVCEFLIPELMGMDFAIAQGEIADAMLRTGFRSVRSFTKHSGMGEMDVTIGRK